MSSPTINSNSSEDTLNQSIKINRNKLSLFHTNAESLRNKVDQMEIECTNHDIVGISETWLNSEIPEDKLQMTGFQNPFRKDRQDGWGGVAIYVRQGIVAKIRKDLDIIGLEAIWCEIKHPSFHYLVCCMYRPPNSNREYWDLIQSSLENARINSPNLEIFLMEDINCDQLKTDNKLSRILNMFNMTQMIKRSNTYNKTI